MALLYPGGTSFGAPGQTDIQHAPAKRTIRDQIYRDNIRSWFDKLDDFDMVTSYSNTEAMTNNTTNNDTSQIPVAAASTSIAYFTVPRTGTVSAASIVPGSTLATSDTNFVTFTLQNLGPANGSNITMLATTPAGINTTKVTGGTALTANASYTLTLSTTAANLAVTAGDVLKLVATVTGTLANIVDSPTANITINVPGEGLYVPFAFKTAGVPSVAALANTNSGVVQVQLGATSEAMTGGVSWGDSLLWSRPDAGGTNVHSTSIPNFQCFFQIPTAITTAQRLLMGLGTAMNATNTSITKIMAFHLEASMNVLLDTRDGTNTKNQQTPSTGAFTLTAGSWYLATIKAHSLDQVEFWISVPGGGDVLLGTQTMAALASTDMFQPFVYLQKASGVTTPSVQVDYLRCRSWRANVT